MNRYRKFLLVAAALMLLPFSSPRSESTASASAAKAVAPIRTDMPVLNVVAPADLSTVEIREEPMPPTVPAVLTTSPPKLTPAAYGGSSRRVRGQPVRNVFRRVRPVRRGLRLARLPLRLVGRILFGPRERRERRFRRCR